ncbi:hypothetical protein ANN_04735 [Periplaneta americana]|uniref:DUF1907 domain-containing protein n=1 Tax=Periplaneta americana TaxID=6978 RepID=A0ABQ8TBM8_PERAM|nr:hypothetical protein ANN_04735 [Periplaneta americana]
MRRYIIKNGLKVNYDTVNVEIVDCPDLTKEPFTLAAEGLGGKPRLVDIGGQSNVFPFPKKEKLYDLQDIGNLVGVRPTFLLGASAGPWTYSTDNTEMMVNLFINEGEIINHSNVSSISKQNGSCILECLPNNETRCAMLANLFCSEGKPGKVLQVTCEKRIGNDDFPGAIRKTLSSHYKGNAIGLGGAFLLKAGKARQHIMPDFPDTPLDTDDQVANWFRYYNMSAPLIAVGTIITTDPGLGLRLQHFHSFSHHGEGGHYHIDTEPDNAEYVGYFSLCEYAFRVDKPANTDRIGID